MGTLFSFQRFCGALAQLGERLLCTQEVSGSIPLGSIRIRRTIRFFPKTLVRRSSILKEQCPLILSGNDVANCSLKIEYLSNSNKKINRNAVVLKEFMTERSENKVKLIRAHGGCLGTRSRRRT